jgi:ribosomal protein L32
MLHLVSEPTLEVSQACGDQMRGHDVCMHVGPSWTRHGTCADTGNTQTWPREEDPGSDALYRISQFGIRQERRILRG